MEDGNEGVRIWVDSEPCLFPYDCSVYESYSEFTLDIGGIPRIVIFA